MNAGAALLTQRTPDCVIAECDRQAHLDLRRVLIIDDTRTIHDDFRKILASVQKSNLEKEDAEMFGGKADTFRGNTFEVDSAYQGAEGLELVKCALKKGTGYSVAFVDVRMPPGWDGIETASRLRAADPDIQIVICTAFSDYAWDTIVKRLGNSDSLVILKKPFDTVEVLQLTHAFSKKWRLTKQATSRFAELEARVDERTEELRVLNQKLEGDIAKRKQAEARLNHLLRQSPAIIFSLKSNAGTSAPTWVSTAKCSFTGCSQEHPEARVGEFVILSVSDTGSGIPAEHLPRLFEPFFTTKEIGKGTGLGLATVHGIVKQHQGWIEVESQIQAGSNFRIYLPAFAGPSLPEDATASEEILRGGTENILLVEDDKAVRTFTCQMLEKFGYQVQVAASGPEALELWRNSPSDFKLLLTDIVMPRGITGIELADQLCGQRADLKIVFMSGYAGDALGQGSANQGQLKHRLIQKPFHSQELIRIVRQCLDETSACA